MPARELLERYAAVAIQVGLGLEPGDRVVISSSIEQLDFTRLLVDTAYEAGAVSVDVFWKDDAVVRSRLTHGPEAAADEVGGESVFRMAGYEARASYLRVFGEDPAALAGVDTARAQRHQRANGRYVEPHADAMGEMKIPWTVISAPTPARSALVFPELGAETGPPGLRSLRRFRFISTSGALGRDGSARKAAEPTAEVILRHARPRR